MSSFVTVTLSLQKKLHKCPTNPPSGLCVATKASGQALAGVAGDWQKLDRASEGSHSLSRDQTVRGYRWLGEPIALECSQLRLSAPHKATPSKSQHQVMEAKTNKP